MSASASILVNGSPTPPFKLNRGLRQGDPLSPFLFNLVVESLKLLIKKGIDNHLLEGISLKKNGIMVSHLQYANDTIIFLPHLEFLLNIKKALILFHLASRLKVTFHKIALIGINVEDSLIELMARALLC